MNLTAIQIADYTQATFQNAQTYEPHLNATMTRFKINTPRRIAAFMATISIESARLTRLEEDLFYKSADRLAAIYPRAFKTAADAAPFARNPVALSQKLYGGYHGRGFICITWLDNYEAASEALGYDYVREPQLVCTPRHAALTAAWFWQKAGCNEAADRGDMADVTKRVNGPRQMHLAERLALYQANIGLLEAA